MGMSGRSVVWSGGGLVLMFHQEGHFLEQEGPLDIVVVIVLVEEGA